MGNKLNAIRRVAKRYLSSSEFRAKFIYTALCDRDLPIDHHLVLFQSYDGNRLGGNPFYILEAMNRDRSLDEYSRVIAVKAEVVESTLRLLQAHGFDNCRVVKLHSREYCEALASARFLVNNSTFPTYFIKREQQIYLNTWHGTPLKTMGRRISDKPWGTGNTQRNFLMADYLLYPNRYTFNHFIKDYMIEQFYKGKYVLGGYPCNSVLLDDRKRKEVRNKLGLEGKRVVAYLPTWRSAQKGGHKDKHVKMLEFALMNLDENLDDDIVVYAQVHYYDARKKINFDHYGRIREFPAEFETYEILNVADVLITDYSSVMFDFLNADKPILLFDYDAEEYFSTRGTYFDMNELPFWRTKDSYELSKRVNEVSRLGHEEYSKEKATFCPYDLLSSADFACSLLFHGDEDPFIVMQGDSFHNDKKNVLVFTGAITKNGLTSALQGLLGSLDFEKANYILTFKPRHVKKASKFFETLDERITYLPMQGSVPMTYTEALARYRYYRRGITNNDTQEKVDRLFSREARRCFPTMGFHSVVHFTGYERDMVHVLLGCKADNRVIFVHSDMVQEKELKGNFHFASLSQAYKEFDRVAVVRKGLVDVMSEGFGIPREKIYVVHNVNKLRQIREGSELPARFDEDTFSTVTLDELNGILDDAALTKFITIGRFSPEKGLLRLISAFKRYIKENDDSVLIIVGGHGSLFGEVLQAAEEADSNRIVVIKSLSNPFAVLSRADVFMMSSLYEGLPMSIMEALILGKPVICTDIPGPREFLNEGYGYIVPDSEEGLYKGFCDYDKGLVRDLRSFDAESFNAEAVEEFYRVVDV